MSELTRPWMVEAMERMKKRMELIGTDATKWHTKPAAVLIGWPADMLNRAAPGIYLDLVELPTRASTADIHFDEALIDIACVTRNAGNRFEALMELVVDVRRCLREMFDDLWGDRVKVFDGGFRVGIQGVEGGAGAGLGTVRATVWVETDDTGSTA